MFVGSRCLHVGSIQVFACKHVGSTHCAYVGA